MERQEGIKESVTIRALYVGSTGYHTMAVIKDVPTFIGYFKTLKKIDEYAKQHYEHYEILYKR